MKKIEAETLENALILASNDFGCSVVDLEYEIIQNPSKGFLGIGKKPAIICAQPKIPLPQEVDSSLTKTKDSLKPLQNRENESFAVSAETKKEEYSKHSLTETARREEFQGNFKNDLKEFDIHSVNKVSDYTKHKNPLNLQETAKEVQKELKELLDLMPYQLSEVFVEPYDENTLYIKIDGADSALLIGKEGYRYKAISYLIFNWVNHQYGLMIRLEIAEFLRNQEEMIANYLLPTIESIKTYGKAQTKPLDGVLAHIALKQLRDQFPDKYVSFRLNSEGERYIVINDFYHS